MAERKIAYEPLRQSANGGFMVKAPSLERLYIDSALALTDHLASLDLLQDSIRQTVSVSGSTREKLMANWLNEILALFQNEKFLCKRIVFNSFDGKKISSTIFGDIYVPTKHGHVRNIKAMTTEQLILGEIEDADLHFFAKISIS